MNLQKRSVLRIGLLIMICSVFLMSCDKNDKSEQIKLEELTEKFEGRYKLISSVADKALDINMDGISSTDLLLENPKLEKARLGIRILEYGYHFIQEMWPMVSSQVSRNEVFDLNKVYSTYGLGYDSYYNLNTCLFNDDLTAIELLKDIQKDEVNTLISVESIQIEGKEIIKIKSVRRIYTIKGWLTSQIESRYKRYTSIT